MKKLYKKGTLCCRCGMLKKERAKGCWLYGVLEKGHMYNDEDLEIEEQQISVEMFKRKVTPAVSSSTAE